MPIFRIDWEWQTLSILLLSDVKFVGHGAPAGKTTMYLMGGCVLRDETHVEHEIGQVAIQPNRTWAVTVSLPLPCRLRWKWKADDELEWEIGKDGRYTNLSMSAGTTVLYSDFGQNTEVKPKGKLYKVYQWADMILSTNIAQISHIELVWKKERQVIWMVGNLRVEQILYRDTCS